MKTIGKINIRGNNLLVVDKIDWSQISFVFCGSESYFEDDVHGVCHQCQMEIVYRPYLPIDVKKICFNCTEKEVKEANEKS
mgnify:CR=1 FL=1